MNKIKNILLVILVFSIYLPIKTNAAECGTFITENAFGINVIEEDVTINGVKTTEVTMSRGNTYCDVDLTYIIYKKARPSASNIVADYDYLGCGDEAVFYTKDINVNENTEDPYVYLRFHTGRVDNYNEDPDNIGYIDSSFTNGSCNVSEASYEAPYIPAKPLSASYNSYSFTYSAPDINITPPIDCNTTQTAGSFEERYCNTRNSFIQSNGGSLTSSNPSTKKTFKCSTEITDEITNPSNLEGEDYFIEANKKYLYYKDTERKDSDSHYQYHYTSGNATTGDAPWCEVTCEEVVEAEMGPPVASKAGMCFEYRVRVTSRVNCYVTAYSDPPSCENSCCSPYPRCHSSDNQHVYSQGGPSEDFDACVKKCDGGKYSKSCSNKCYKEVYGSAVPAAKMNNKFLDDVVASKVATSPTNIDTGGSFSCGSDGHPVFNSSFDSGNGTAPWYGSHSWGCSGSTYTRVENGIPRAQNCNDTCQWEGCNCGSEYICPAEDRIRADCEANTQTYENFINSCNAEARCSETTSTITIEADYRKLNNTSESIPIKFTNESDIILPDFPTDGQGTLGCYKSGTPSTEYRKTWGFPGTWINSKSGEISYQRQGTCGTSAGSTCSWQEQKQKFCVPVNAANVNQKWWNLFYYKIINDNNIETSTDEQEVRDACLTTTFGTVIEPNPTYTIDDWNIKAETKNFGYYNWNIEMQCFYALNSTPLSIIDTPESNVPEECNTRENYRIRSIDLENVFPATNGDPQNDPDTYGRMPGHNWTKYSNPSATDASYNNPDYFETTSDPISYLSKIQRTKEDIYGDNNLEYEFYISPREIRNIRKMYVGENANSNYNGFSDYNQNDFYVDGNGVIRYFSNRIRDGIISSYKAKGANEKTGALSCNNMVSYLSSDCES